MREPLVDIALRRLDHQPDGFPHRVRHFTIAFVMGTVAVSIALEAAAAIPARRTRALVTAG